MARPMIIINAVNMFLFFTDEIYLLRLHLLSLSVARQ